MKPYYECHITFFAFGPQPELPAFLEKNTGWKYSQIDGDPVLGPGVKCYLTKHYPAATDTSHQAAESDRIIGLMGKAADYVRECGMDVLRQKIELVIYDTKSNSEIRS